MQKKEIRQYSWGRWGSIMFSFLDQLVTMDDLYAFSTGKGDICKRFR